MTAVRAGLAALLLAAVAVVAQPLLAAHPPPLRGRGGAVVSEQAAATRVGLEILRRGGNAVDAAVATALALAVVHPEAGNLGGGGFAVVKIGERLSTLDFRETAPARATVDLYLDPDGSRRPEASLVGPLAAGVPGSPTGLFELHRRLGSLPWSDLVAPAARLAEAGFVVSSSLYRSLAEQRDLLARFPETAAVWLPGGEPPVPGSRLRLNELAATLRAYGEEGATAITRGPVAAAVVEASRRYGGILSEEDLAGYRPVWRDPLRFEVFGWRFAAMDLPSSGGIIVGQSLMLLKKLGWSGSQRFGADRAHLAAEVWRRAFADRFLLGDTSTALASAAELLDPGWLAERVRGIDRQRSTPSREVLPWPGEVATEAVATTHLSVVDGAGALVALTTTLNGLFGCGLMVPGAGFLLNNEMDDFTTAPGQPNDYGLIQGAANSVGPGKRMLSSMSPTVVWRGEEAVALGGRGGSRIPTATAQVLANFLVDGDELQAAIDRPRIHHQWLPDQITAEPDALSPETYAELEQRGHRIAIESGLAKVHAVRVLPGGRVEAAADPRGPGFAGVVEPDP